jgi:hypothetical protein
MPTGAGLSETTTASGVPSELTRVMVYPKWSCSSKCWRSRSAVSIGTVIDVRLDIVDLPLRIFNFDYTTLGF